MGVVYRAQDPAIGRVVAIKTIRLGDLADPAEQAKLRDRLMREAQSAGDSVPSRHRHDLRRRRRGRIGLHRRWSMWTDQRSSADGCQRSA